MRMDLPHRRFTVDEYYRMAKAGILSEDDRLELLDGEIVEMTPIGGRHAAVVTRLDDLFHELVADRATVRVQNPVHLHDFAEPQPDVALVTRHDDRYASGHPTPDILLIVEVPDTSLSYDRERKAPAYAAAAIPEVWLVDLTADGIELYRDPPGGEYRDRQLLGPDATLTILRLPGIMVPAIEILG